jgi:hypothetical protein
MLPITDWIIYTSSVENYKEESPSTILSWEKAAWRSLRSSGRLAAGELRHGEPHCQFLRFGSIQGETQHTHVSPQKYFLAPLSPLIQ